MADKKSMEFLIASLDPFFLDKGEIWFSENISKIKNQALTNSWWQKNILFFEKNLKLNPSEFMRKISDMGYEKVQTIASPGEFASRGGIIDIFPANSLQALRLEFFGNKIESIISLGEKINDDLRLKILNKKIKAQEKSQEESKEFKEGDYIVHLDHGIGIFRGSAVADQFLNSELQTPNSFFIIEYATPKHGQNPDRLYVPLEQAQKLSLYIGFENPTVHRLGSEIWLKTKHKIKEDVEKFAKELLEIYAKREISTRPPYHLDDQMQRDFESQFKHFETEDQLKAIEDIKKDMALAEPMDRLICGDVGFGKTEVALRAAFKAVMSGRQVALLCPTTILADQHFETFSERLKNFPLKTALMSRMESKQNQQKSARELEVGKIDIIIGTHRLLSNDIHFKNLGLLIIDEEQRFGVKQKEKFKHLREEVDILSLSATPIPRTMYLALSGMRKISTIQTPPPGRKAIETFVLPYSENIIIKAVKKELSRHGQIFFLYNRVQTIQSEAMRLRKIMPNLKIAIAHGRMSEGQLRKIIHDFRDKKYDLLLATTIIENGLDLPNANTLIVANATRLGLAQSYQLRGRIGRSDKTAHAYFLYNEKELKNAAKERLEALESATELGDGWKIAQKDLEIRGAGNILGRSQSGNMNKVGLNLYCQILSEAVEKLKNK
ncbi:hypothetical protein A2907_01490 [Candidatus Azambacteria bacterium RIFCSPLOWO2_01_FULL_37_9]|uniref:Transcription-repair-coupling factor n=1 Tax=Candidatus Azambacteria bacterium RIFCSPLOWO2_01_FULL_37_9 TaxID=1797297 RepID=A0A1F5C8Z8_9BACT|nr:MAG: hypothetical protein A2907_01490 [Candidatus Azambacteria bacterium RIFCSPLOWO2_01_FULL_37_9]